MMEDILRRLDNLENAVKSAGYKFAEVYDVSESGVQVKFPEDEEPSPKEYKHASSYTPKKGDKVVLAKTAGTYIIIDTYK